MAETIPDWLCHQEVQAHQGGGALPTTYDHKHSEDQYRISPNTIHSAGYSNLEVGTPRPFTATVTTPATAPIAPVGF
ncbi:hypothetical protein WJX79_009859 [Trebouxia sp. C0005]